MNTSTDDLSFDCNLFFFLVEWCIVVFAFCCHEIPRRQKKCAKPWVYKQRYSFYGAFSNNIICSQNASNDVTGTILIILRLVFIFRYDCHQMWVPFLELCHHILETFL